MQVDWGIKSYIERCFCLEQCESLKDKLQNIRKTKGELGVGVDRWESSDLMMMVLTSKIIGIAIYK